MGQEKELVKQIEDSIEIERYLQREARNIIAISEQLISAFKKGNKEVVSTQSNLL